MTTFNGTLDVTISDAQGGDIQHLSRQDPYCIVTLGSSGLKRMMEGSRLGKEKFRTKVHNGGGTHPVWNESHTFNLKNMKLDSHLKVKIYDKDTIKDDYIGVAKVNLDELLLQDRKGVKYYPFFKKGALHQTKSTPIGQVGVAVAFNCTEIPMGQADLKSQTRDVLTRKHQQLGGVSEPLQTAQPASTMQQGVTGAGLGTTVHHHHHYGPMQGTTTGGTTGMQQTHVPMQGTTGMQQGMTQPFQGQSTGVMQQGLTHPIQGQSVNQPILSGTKFPQTQGQVGQIPSTQVQGQVPQQGHYY